MVRVLFVLFCFLENTKVVGLDGKGLDHDAKYMKAPTSAAEWAKAGNPIFANSRYSAYVTVI